MPQKSIVELAAISTFLHNSYNGMENIVKQCLASKNITIEQDNSWHKRVVQTAQDNNIITAATADKLYEYLAFRHFFVHSYSFRLEEAQLATLVESLPAVWREFVSEINLFFGK
jgi:uncharacterized protein YutE (UPF0331/DUF86 family)